MDFNFFDLIKIAGALALFIYGMKVMSDGIQRAAGIQIRSILKSLTKNRFVGFLTGLFTTAAVQTSSATTVMTVSLVNAGLINLRQSAGLILGANIGTTITAWIIAGIGFKFSIDQIVLPILLIGVPLLLRKKGQAKHYGEFLVGFSLLILGLNLMTQSVPDIGSNESLLLWFQQYSGSGFSAYILFLFIGIVITVIIQSSSAAMALTLAVCVKGWIPIELGAAMIIGENIGTTITAEVAALVGNADAKRSARFHTLFNIIGALWMMFLIPIVMDMISGLMVAVGQASPKIHIENTPIALASFHTAYNVINVLILFGLTPYIEKLAILSIPDRKEAIKMPLKFITSGSLTPELKAGELQKETAHFAEIVSRMTNFTRLLLNAIQPSERIQLLERIKKYESITDSLEKEITNYISEASSEQITTATSKRLSSYYTVCNNLERIGDIFYQMALDLEKKIEGNIWFSPDQRNALNEMLNLIDQSFIKTIFNLQIPDNKNIEILPIQELDKRIKDYYLELRNDNFNNIHNEEFNIKGTLIFYNLITFSENISSHLININENLHRKNEA